jgi:hypothetical protein
MKSLPHLKNRYGCSAVPELGAGREGGVDEEGAAKATMMMVRAVVGGRGKVSGSRMTPGSRSRLVVMVIIPPG